MTVPATLVGNWEKPDGPSCSERYPAFLEIESTGLYRGRAKIPGTFTEWDDGTIQLGQPGQLRISTANDAIVAYDFQLEGDSLAFTDPEGCRFSYRRTR